MDAKSTCYRFDQAVSALPNRLRDILTALPDSVKECASEVRLRVDKPMVVTTPHKSWFVDLRSQLHNIPGACFPVTSQELEQAVVSMCSYSVHSHQNEIKSGFISLRGGHRAGLCGTAVVSGENKITAVRSITSINLRIARDVKGAADEVVRKAFADKVCGLLVAGPPGSGKTTILRDIARQLASGSTRSGYLKVAVVDERGEIGAVHEGVPQNDLGASCDILSGYPKGEGILHAVRTLSPQIIICDEIGGEEEVTSMLDGLHCGVKLVASAHADTVQELLQRRQIVRLLQENAFGAVALLGGSEAPGRVVQILKAEELRYEGGRYAVARPVLYPGGDAESVELVR